MGALEIKLDKKTFINNIEKLVLRRYSNIKDINYDIYDLIGIKVLLEHKTRHEEEQEYDYCLMSNCDVNNEDLCFLDIYYLKDNGGQMLITEVGYDFNT